MTLQLREGTRLRAGRYELLRHLGSGGAASVWLATDAVLDRPVAVKVLSEALAHDESWLTRFRREARMAAGLQHPNLVSVYDFDADFERPYLVMSYLPGGSLHERIETGERVDSDRLARDLLSALAAIHAGGIVHRDVKPGNLLFDADGRACLTDFGIARLEDATALTQTGHIPGTQRYMAPELWQGDPATERSDLYAAGVVLSRCLRENPAPQLERLIERLSAQDPSLRPASANAALELLGDREPTPATRVSAAAERPLPRPDPVRQIQVPRWAPIAALALLVLVVGVAVASSLGGDDEPNDSAANQKSSASSDQNGGGQRSEEAPQAAETELAPEEPDATIDPVALDQEGKALLDAGDPEGAIPLLEQAVDFYEPSSRELQYGYSLFNLAQAYRLAGRPEDAIPLLERRLKIPDQTEAVQVELDLALEEAGKPPRGPKPPKKPKKPKG